MTNAPQPVSPITPRRRAPLRIALMMCLFVFSTLVHTNVSEARTNNKYAALVMDVDTGLILYSRYADKKLHPASLAKMMTLLLTFEAMEEGKIRRRDRILISRNAANAVPSKLGLAPGSSIQVEEAIYSLVTKSANDVAVAVAEHIGGSEENFARMMTRKARQIGMSRTVFKNASGLHNPQQVTTARDIARLSQYLIRDYQDYYHYFSTKSFSYRGKNYNNHNRLMNYYEGMDGLKTGYIRAAGFNLAASVKRGNKRLVGIVFGGRSSKTRNDHMQKILDRSFAKIDRIMVAKASAPPKPAAKPRTVIASAKTQNNVTKLAAIAPAAGASYGARLSAQKTLSPASAQLLNAKPTLFEEEIGEGDFDPGEIDRFRTGLLAISAMKSVKDKSLEAHSTFAENKIFGKDWAIQIGAFRNRNKVETLTQDVIRRLPYVLEQGQTQIYPLRTSNGTIYRGRITLLSKDEAKTACKVLRDCITIAPR